MKIHQYTAINTPAATTAATVKVNQIAATTLRTTHNLIYLKMSVQWTKPKVSKTIMKLHQLFLLKSNLIRSGRRKERQQGSSILDRV